MTSTQSDAVPFADWFPDADFDASHGYRLADLERIEPPAAPADFDDFWHGLRDRAAEVDPDPVLSAPQHRDHLGGTEVFEVRFTALGGVRLGGWFARPTTGPIRRAMVVSHGYGGRGEVLLDELPPECAAIYPVARGLPTLSLLPGVADVADGHVLHGIDSPDTYIHGGCAADIWAAADALLQLLPQAPERLDYWGSSFGGGIGALALPWDPRFASAVLIVPSFGHHDLRLTMRCTGSGEPVRHYAAEHPEVRRTLAYFDAATAATRIGIPVLVAPALWDPAVPPPGQFAVANALAGPVERFVLSAGHTEYPAEAAEQADLDRARAAFLQRPAEEPVTPGRTAPASR